MMEDGNRNLPEHAFPLQSWEVERTDLFEMPGQGKDRSSLLMAMRDPGAAAAFMPVLERLADEPVDIRMFADSRAKEALQKSSLGFVESSPKSPLLSISVSAEQCDLAVVGISDSPGSELVITDCVRDDQKRRGKEKPVVWVSDFVMGSIFRTYRDGIKSHPGAIPDYLLVANEWVREQELANLPPGFDPTRVVITGQPAFDKLAHEDRDETRRAFRQEKGIGDNEKLIAYIGSLGKTSSESLEVLVDGLQQSGYEDYRLVIRRHPRDTITVEDYANITEPVRSKVVDTTGKTTDQVMISSDLVVNTLSTAGLEAVYRGIPVLHILIPDVIAKITERGLPVPTTPPIVEDGSSPAIYHPNEAADMIKKLLTVKDYGQQLEERMARWKVDGHAAERVTDFIMKLARESRA